MQGKNFNPRFTGSSLLHDGNGIGLIVFNTDITFGSIYSLHNQFKTHDDIFCPLQHGPDDLPLNTVHILPR